MIDFGMVGEVSDEHCPQLGRLLHAFMSSDPGRVSLVPLDPSIAPSSLDRAARREDTQAFIRPYQGKSLGQLDIGP